MQAQTKIMCLFFFERSRCKHSRSLGAKRGRKADTNDLGNSLHSEKAARVKKKFRIYIPRYCRKFQESQIDPWPRHFRKVLRYTSISIAILLQKYALFLAERSIYTTNLYHDTPPISIAILLQKYWGQGLLEHPPKIVAKLSLRINSWGIIFGAVAQSCCCSLLSCCLCGMLPGISLHNDHSVIAPKYVRRIISGWIETRVSFA